jgi:hypothetical protein
MWPIGLATRVKFLISKANGLMVIAVAWTPNENFQEAAIGLLRLHILQKLSHIFRRLPFTIWGPSTSEVRAISMFVLKKVVRCPHDKFRESCPLASETLHYLHWNLMLWKKVTPRFAFHLLLMVSCLDHSSTLKVETICPSASVGLSSNYTAWSHLFPYHQRKSLS